MPDFDRVSVCTPMLNVLVAPSDGNYSVAVASADPVPITADVRDGELVLGTSGPFSTSRAIKIIIAAPKDVLTKIAAAPLSSDIYVDRGFAPSGGNFTVTSHLATGRVVLRGMEADTLFLAGSGGAAFYANASRGATVKADLGGVSSAALFNAPKEVDLLLSGAAAVDTYGAADTIVRGAALGANTVTVPRGVECAVTGPFGLGSPCVRVRGDDMPSVAVIPLWSCGIRADGPFTCPAPEKNGGAQGVAAAAAPAAAPGALATQPLVESAPVMGAAPAPAMGPSADVASGGRRRLAQAAAAAGGMMPRFVDRPPLPTLTNFAGSRVALLPCVEAPMDLVVGMDGMMGQ